MAFANFSPGPYSLTYGGTTCGLLDRPLTLRRMHSAQFITVDLYGDTFVDGVYRGGNVYLMAHFAEWNANLRTMLNPYSATFLALGIPGQLLSDKAAAIVITPTASTPAATLGNNTFTFSKAILAPQNNVDFLLGSVHRNIPVLFLCLAYDSSGTIVHGVMS